MPNELPPNGIRKLWHNRGEKPVKMSLMRFAGKRNNTDGRSFAETAGSTSRLRS
jgi:hypothetical protein